MPDSRLLLHFDKHHEPEEGSGQWTGAGADILDAQCVLSDPELRSLYDTALFEDGVKIAAALAVRSQAIQLQARNPAVARTERAATGACP